MKEGWQSRPLDDVCEFTSGLWKGKKPPFVTVGVIRMTNFKKDGGLDDLDIPQLDVEARQFEKRRLQFGDIILEKSGGGPKQAVGRVALFDKTQGDFSFSNFTAALRVRDPDELDFRFLHKYLYWTHLSGVTEGMQSHSTGIRNLDNKAYKAMHVPLPPISEQQRIVAILDEAFEGIATAIANAEKSLRNARAVFESHLDHVFGEAWRTSELVMLSDLAQRTVFKGGEAVKLTRIEYALLATLAASADRVVTSKALTASVWGESVPDDNRALRVHVSNLRAKIEREPSLPQHVVTEPGLGYRFMTQSL